MSPDIVIRPAGVWNTRYPFNRFIFEYKTINRLYALTELMSLRTKRSIELEDSAQRGVRSHFVKRKGQSRRHAPRERGAWMAYRRALGRAPEGGWLAPSFQQVAADAEGVILVARQAAIIRFVSTFEVYMACWTLNILLAKLETGCGWTDKEREVAAALSPVHAPKRPLRISELLRGLPEIREALDSSAVFDRSLVSGELIDVGVSFWSAMSFWIDLRNLLVHRGGWVSTSFAHRYADTWARVLGRVPTARLIVGARVSTPQVMVDRAGFCAYRAARVLNQVLSDESGGRRGDITREIGDAQTPDPEMQLLLGRMIEADDHDLSYRWVNDRAFRERIVRSGRFEAD